MKQTFTLYYKYCPWGIITFMDAREDSGTPFSYFPVMIPQARGDQDTTPTPTRIRKDQLYVKNGMQLNMQKIRMHCIDITMINSLPHLKSLL